MERETGITLGLAISLFLYPYPIGLFYIVYFGLVISTTILIIKIIKGGIKNEFVKKEKERRS